MNSLYDIEVLGLKKKSKEELEKEWQEFTKEQEKAFAELLISNGIKPKYSIQENSEIGDISDLT